MKGRKNMTKDKLMSSINNDLRNLHPSVHSKCEIIHISAASGTFGNDSYFLLTCIDENGEVDIKQLYASRIIIDEEQQTPKFVVIAGQNRTLLLINRDTLISLMR